MNVTCGVKLADFVITRDDAGSVIPPAVLGACASLLHVSIPYLVAFEGGADFSWERDARSVHACCPVGAVEFRIDRPRGGSGVINVMRASGCPMYRAGDRIVVPMQPGMLEIIDAVFPVLPVVQNRGGRVSVVPARSADTWTIQGSSFHPTSLVPLDPCILEGTRRLNGREIHVLGMRRTCAHHRDTGLYPDGRVMPSGTCGFAYHAAYPTFLAMLYGGTKAPVVFLSCPGTRARVSFALIRTSKPAKPLLRLLARVLRAFHVPQDIITERVMMRVVRVSGTCEQGLVPGTTYPLGGNRRLCASSFDVLFPGLVNASSGSRDRPDIYSCTSLPCKIQYCLGRCAGKAGTGRGKVA